MNAPVSGALIVDPPAVWLAGGAQASTMLTAVAAAASARSARRFEWRLGIEISGKSQSAS
jgi:hypothetical protein